MIIKREIVGLVGLIIGLASVTCYAGSISNTFATGDTLTATQMNSVKSAVNDNDSRVTTNSSDIKSNATAISTNKSGVSTNASGISSLNSRVSAVEGKIELHQLGYAWTYPDNSTLNTPYTPQSQYSYNSSGNGITVTRTATGQYTVVFSGLDGSGGTVSVTSYGSGNSDTCHVARWQNPDWKVYVECYDSSGTAADSQFTITVTSMTP